MAEMQPLVPTNERINQFKFPQGKKFLNVGGLNFLAYVKQDSVFHTKSCLNSVTMVAT